LGVADADRLLLFVGALGYDRNKGFDTLLEAHRQLVARRRERIHLLAAGNGKLDYWRRLAAATGSGQFVRLVGARTDVPRLMAAADALVSPTRYDSYGLAVHEALCLAVPAIVSKAAGVAERFPADLEDLILPDPESAVDLARRIEIALDERPRLQPAIDALSQRLRAWTWDDMAAAMVQIIDENA
jgi:glycosyltransferase involved in cell wall biosynthesis